MTTNGFNNLPLWFDDCKACCEGIKIAKNIQQRSRIAFNSLGSCAELIHKRGDLCNNFKK